MTRRTSSSSSLGISIYTKVFTDPNPDTEKYSSLELHVSVTTPPTFLVHASDDPILSSQNCILFYNSLIEFNHKPELHIYSKGGHGFGLAANKDRLQNWTLEFVDWINNL